MSIKIIPDQFPRIISYEQEWTWKGSEGVLAAVKDLAGVMTKINEMLDEDGSVFK